MQPHRQQPTRLPCPWDSPGKNPGVGCHFLLQWVKVKSESEVAQWCRTPSDPMDCSPPGSSVHGICQARVLEWDAIAFSVDDLRGILLFFRRRKWQPTPVLLLGEFHGQRSLVGYSQWDRKDSDRTERLTHTHTHTHTKSLNVSCLICRIVNENTGHTGLWRELNQAKFTTSDSY